MLTLSMTEKNTLRTQFRMEFDKNEIKNFYYNLDLEIDNLESTSRDKLIFDLIHHTERTNKLPMLLQMAQELRPNANFLASVPSIAANTAPVVPSATMNEAAVSSVPEVFISYAWNARDNDENERIVNLLDERLRQKGITIIRDKRDLTYRGNIKEFMQRIGRGKYVIVVISEKYLKSENCMFELLEIFSKGNFADRIFPIVLENADIYKPVNRIKYVAHWENEIKELDQAMKTVSSANLQGFRESIDNYTAIRNVIAEMTETIKNMNTLTPDMHENEHFDSLYHALQLKIQQDQL